MPRRTLLHRLARMDRATLLERLAMAEVLGPTKQVRPTRAAPGASRPAAPAPAPKGPDEDRHDG